MKTITAIKSLTYNVDELIKDFIDDNDKTDEEMLYEAIELIKEWAHEDLNSAHTGIIFLDENEKVIK